MKIREYGVTIGQLPTGEKNDITDVPDVRVGHVTIQRELEGDQEYACTGVTAIVPHGGSLFREKVTAASYVINGFGKTTGLVQVNELGVLESPIMLTNTFSVPAVTQGTLEYMLAGHEEIGDTTGTINLVVGECNDSSLNSIRRCVVQPQDAIEAIQKATNGPVEEGAVGAGTGMVTFGYKGGIGSSSRIVSAADASYTVGVLVLSNFGSKHEFLVDKLFPAGENSLPAVEKPTDGSIIMVLATDAPLSDRQLLRVAKRAGIGLGRTGSHFGHGSGDIVIAFSTAHKIPHKAEGIAETRTQLREDHAVMNQLFAAAAEATEEAIYNSLSQAKTTTGRKGNTVYAFPFERFGIQ
ncbi:P1 family peptidase [Brevibacillus nitrificans]|uniref:DmpA family aminopeptidase n=1 Tax=Brevibacillus nitrificans TaxID=651560 RepID=UPI00285E8450|nr:P1 family peptidase [Brevibacillus nitrificans]MDR7317053.1 D-aminopeptidase [Brevibacillus nitrificans]